MDQLLTETAAIQIDVEVDRTVNFAMQQNDVPIIRTLQIFNPGDNPVENLSVLVSSEPELFAPWTTSISSIPAGGTHVLGPLDLRLSPSLLIGLTERAGGNIRIELSQNGRTLAEHIEPIEMLAFDEWNGMGRALPELLAAFVLPNHPIVESLLSDAARWLADKTGDSSLSGYQSKSPARVGQIAQAIYVAIQSRGISYCNPPASFEETGQKIRLPDRIMEHKLATCLDLAVLAAACLEQAGLYPIVAMIPGHAFPGVWLIDECFPDCATDDLLRVRKRVDLNDILVFETTLTTAPPPNDFAAAIAPAKRHLGAINGLHCVVDIQRCRKSRVRPLPVRREADAQLPSPESINVSKKDTLFELSSTADEGGNGQSSVETPTSRLGKWKRRLLDLTLHNRQINFKSTKKTVPLLCPDLTSLEDALANGLEFQLLPRPREFGSESDRSIELHRVRTGDDPLNQILLAELKSRRLRADLTELELKNRLTDVYRTARTAMEEGGASTLYLALGFLAWYETESSEQQRLAPIILVPVELRRTSIQEGYRICQSDEEPRVNISLLELLQKDFDLNIPNMEPIPEDDHGIDVRGILKKFRQSIKNTNRWDVVEDAHIGFFSFSKFLMWRDLEQRTDELLRNRVVDHLVNRPNESFPDDGRFPDEKKLDDEHPPEQTFCPLPADSSQLAAVFAAAEKKSFVLFGPPGTGKSQTITNIISHTLANDQSVLFVSEKVAALNVVHNRLVQCGLGPFCLELHSNKSNKNQVITQLGEALDYTGSRSQPEWQREAKRLATLRAELNDYVRALHQRRECGESVYTATSILCGLRDVAPIDLGFAECHSVTRERLDELRENIDRVVTAALAIGHPTSCVWNGCSVDSWSPAVQRAIEDSLKQLIAVCDRLHKCTQTLGPRLRIGLNWNISYLEFAEKFVRLLGESPQPTAAILTEHDWDAIESAINGWLAHGRKRDKLRAKLFARYESRLLEVDLDGLAAKLRDAMKAWFVPRWFGVRAVCKSLSACAKQRETLNAETASVDLKNAIELRQEEMLLAECGERARVLLGNYWSEGEADWDKIESVRNWSQRFRKYALAAASGDAAKAAEFRQHWTRLITEGQGSLHANGELAVAIAEFLDAHGSFKKLSAGLSALLGCGTSPWGADAKRALLPEIRTKLLSWSANLQLLRAWCNWSQVRREAIADELEPLINAFESNGLPTSALRQTFDRSFFEAYVNSITQKEKPLLRFFSSEHERKIRQFRDLDAKYTELTKLEIQARLAAGRPTTSSRVNEESEIGILQRQRRLRRGHMHVRQLFQKIPNLLHRLKPCVLMSPISVAQYLDASHPPFDLVVFDEASQIPAWDAVGAIGRGKEVVIVGDPKQLPPTNFFSRADEPDRTDDDAVEEMESILNECLSGQMPQMALRWHYRSRHESLIAFSNYNYYDNSLYTFPSPFVGKGVSLHAVAGVYDKGHSRTNRAEAEAVVAEVIRRLRDPSLSNQSIGVVTFSVAQQGLVEDLLDEARREHPEIESFFCADHPEPVFIKNLENVQGDERDVILFSICYGPDAEGRVSINFGPLNRDGGERRLNVAITRARSEVRVYSTLKAEQIDLSRSRAQGVRDLKCFLDYAERGPVALSQATTLKGGDEFDSPFEKAVCQKLRDRGHQVHTQVGCSGYRIDLAILDPDAPGRYLLGIECDGANYHSAKTARDRDRLREAVLVGLGWQLHRVWSSDWWVNPEECLSKIDAAIEQAMLKRNVKPEANPPTSSSDAIAANATAASTVARPMNTAKLTLSAPTAYKALSTKRMLGTPNEFYSTDADELIKRTITKVVKQEGPVAVDMVARRVAAHWGIQRVGANIRERLSHLVILSDVKSTSNNGTDFLWPANLDHLTYCTFRVQGNNEEDQRGIEEIAPEEILAATIHVLRQQVSLPKDALIRETALVFGFQRTGATVQRIIDEVIEAALAKGCLLKDTCGRITFD